MRSPCVSIPNRFSTDEECTDECIHLTETVKIIVLEREKQEKGIEDTSFLTCSMNEGKPRIWSVSSPLGRISLVRLATDDRYVQATNNRFVTPIYVQMETKRDRERRRLHWLCWHEEFLYSTGPVRSTTVELFVVAKFEWQVSERPFGRACFYVLINCSRSLILW